MNSLVVCAYHDLFTSHPWQYTSCDVTTWQHSTIWTQFSHTLCFGHSNITYVNETVVHFLIIQVFVFRHSVKYTKTIVCKYTSRVLPGNWDPCIISIPPLFVLCFRTVKIVNMLSNGEESKSPVRHMDILCVGDIHHYHYQHTSHIIFFFLVQHGFLVLLDFIQHYIWRSKK